MRERTFTITSHTSQESAVNISDLKDGWTRGRLASALLLLILVGGGVALGAWKYRSLRATQAAAASQPEPAESVVGTVAKTSPHGEATTTIGTVVALRSIRLRNELPGTVRRVSLEPGDVVEAGTVLVALDVAVERADLEAQEAQAKLAEVSLSRMQRMADQRAVSAMELDAAVAQRDVARAQVAHTRAIIERKTIRAPFRARVGIADVHPGQYLNEGTELTTLQGVDKDAHVDFTVPQRVASTLRHGAHVQVFTTDGATPIEATILAIDARVDPGTRNATVRARIADAERVAPGASVRVRVPTGDARMAVTVPVSALRKGPEGDHVFVLSRDERGETRAHVRPVRTGTVLGDDVVIESGLEAGEHVAVSGSFKLREAALVAVVEDSPPLAAN
jgi:membrane fusion protein (multidrug efflux system)